MRGRREQEGDDDDDEGADNDDIDDDDDDADDSGAVWGRRVDCGLARLPLTLVNGTEVTVGTVGRV